MRISEKGLDLIKEFEGFSVEPYLDVAGVPTIGYGTTHYSNGVHVSMNDKPITREYAEGLLRHQVDAQYSWAVNHYVGVPITQEQFDALVSFTYNLGTGSLKQSTLLRKLNTGDYEGAVKEFKKWDHAGGHVVKGLLARRKKEAELFLA